MPDGFPKAVLDEATSHLRDVLEQALEHTPKHAAVVVWDARSPLARALAGAYRRCLPDAHFIEFDSSTPAQVLEAFEPLEAGDLVVLVQSTSFRLDAFRIRIELFRRSLKVIEHPHLARMPGAQGCIYLEALAYDRDYIRGVGRALKQRIDRAGSGAIDSGGEQLVFPSAFEEAKLNIGDYSGLRNVGGQFPIGEVFTESRELEAVHGRVRIACFGDMNFTVNHPEHPITLIVEEGRVTGTLDSTPEFERVLASIRADEGQVWVRELGFGLNRALSHDRRVTDIGTFERMCGVHLSLGAKHMSYNKPSIRKRAARHHVDVFPLTETLTLDDEVVFRDGAWLIGPPH